MFLQALADPYRISPRSSAGARATVSTEAIQLQFVVLNMEAEPADDLFLQRLDLDTCKLGDLAALGADDVVVMALAGGMLEQGAPVAELSLMGKPGVFQEFQGPIDGHEPDSRVPTPHPAVEAFGADVGRGSEEGPRDQLALAGRLQPGSMKVLLELEKFIVHRKESENDYQYR